MDLNPTLAQYGRDQRSGLMLLISELGKGMELVADLRQSFLARR
jgi:hypothetical protein